MSNSNEQISSAIWIAILHYQNFNHTKACLDSIKSLNGFVGSVLITSNGSPDQTTINLKEEFPGYHILELPDNLGFSGGSNASIEYCIKQGADWVFILNNDTLLDPDCLLYLIEQANQNNTAGVLGACIFTPSQEGFHKSGSGQIDFIKGKTYERGEFDPEQSYIICPWISGCNMLIRTKAFISVNGFDNRYFLYFEDTDLCLRLNKSAWTCLLVPKAKITHIGCAATQGSFSIWRSYYYMRNRLLFFSIHSPKILFVFAFISIFFHLVKHLFCLPFRGQNAKRQLKAELLGFRDFILKRFGKANCLDF